MVMIPHRVELALSGQGLSASISSRSFLLTSPKTFIYLFTFSAVQFLTSMAHNQFGPMCSCVRSVDRRRQICVGWIVHESPILRRAVI